jgi:hypothetical protein
VCTPTTPPLPRLFNSPSQLVALPVTINTTSVIIPDLPPKSLTDIPIPRVDNTPEVLYSAPVTINTPVKKTFLKTRKMTY